MAVRTIDAIRRRYRNEWLVIRVTKFDKATTTPLAGRVLVHSPDRDVIFRKSMRYRGLVMVDHANSGRLPKGYAAAF